MSDLVEKNSGLEKAADARNDAVPQARWSMPVVLKLTLLVGVTLTILLAVLLTANWLYWVKVRQLQMQSYLSAVAASRQALVVAQIEQLRQRIEMNTDRGGLRVFFTDLADGQVSPENRAAAQLSLERIADKKPIVTASLVNEAGIIVLSTDAEQVGRDVSRWPEFRPGTIKPHVGAPHPVKDTFDAVLSAPIRGRDDSARDYGVLLAVAKVPQLAHTILDDMGLGQSGETLFGKREGDQLRLFFPPRNAPETRTVPLDAAPALRDATGGVETFLITKDYRGVPVLAAGRPIGYGGWALAVKIDESEAYVPIQRALRLSVVAGIGAGVLGLIAAYVMALSFTRPIRRLAQAASRVASGNYDAPVPVQSSDELGALSANFNEMTAAIRARRAERDEADQALRESEERSRQMTESLPLLVWTCRADGKCDYLGPQWVEYTGIPETRHLEFGWMEQVHPDDRERVTQLWKSAVEKGTIFDMAFRLRRQDGVHRWFRTRAAPLRDHDGRVVKWFGTNTDIDEGKRAEEILRKADRRKDEFLAMLGHELRNPLSGIANAVRLWDAAADNPDVHELARGVIARQTSNLSRLVDDLLDVVRITEGKIELRKSAVAVSAAITRAVESVRPLLEERRHTLELSLDDAGLCVEADPVRLEQILVNLLTNAVKYTPDGGQVTVVQRHEGRDAVITVSDNGIGIGREMMPHLFELFTQADRSLERTSGGLGIGLNLCRQLVELHGGSISAHSNGLGHGASFTVRFPAMSERDAAFAPPVTVRPVPMKRRRRILLVDDNVDTVRSLSRLLALRGHEVATAHDGLAALKAAREFHPNILLLDIGLPGLDGYSLARQLRAEGFSETPMFAISGYAQDADRTRAREAGFDRHFTKPINFEELASILGADAELLRAG